MQKSKKMIFVFFFKTSKAPTSVRKNF